MKKIYSIILAGAMALGAISFLTACSDDSELDDVKSRVSVLESAYNQLKSDIAAAAVTGSTVLSASQSSDGAWTIKLSDGKTIDIPAPSKATSVTVEETSSAFVITVDDKTYTLPKSSSAAINSLVYVPEYEDGYVLLGNDGATVKFRATPTLSAEAVAAATFDIVDANEAKTRANADIFVVSSAGVDGEYVVLNIKGHHCLANKTYLVAVGCTVNGTTISSDYFTVKIASNFYYDTDGSLETPEFVEGVGSKALDGDYAGYHTATIPDSGLKFIEGFNLKDYFSTLPDGNIEFEVAPAELQNSEVQKHYDTIVEALSSDGTWSLQSRLGTDCNVDDVNTGILIYTTADKVVKNRIFWIIEDPIKSIDFKTFLTKDGFKGMSHLEFGTEESVSDCRLVPTGAGVYDISNILLTAGELDTDPATRLLHEPIYLRFDHANSDLAILQEASLTDADGEELIGNDGETFVIGDPIAPYVGHGRGLVWRTTQPSWASSVRENWTDEEKSIITGAMNGEIIAGWDGGSDIPGLMGWSIDERGLVMTEDYHGLAMRSGIGMFLEYEYGKSQVGPWHWFFLWVNRRVCPVTTYDDPAAR